MQLMRLPRTELLASEVIIGLFIYFVNSEIRNVNNLKSKEQWVYLSYRSVKSVAGPLHCSVFRQLGDCIQFSDPVAPLGNSLLNLH